VIDARRVHRRGGQDWLGAELGIPARTVSRILRRHDVARLCVCDPLAGELPRASKTTAVRCERDRLGEPYSPSFASNTCRISASSSRRRDCVGARPRCL
jgi:hypothetical protein